MGSENKFLVPAAVIIAGLLIGGAVFFKDKVGPAPTNTDNQPTDIDLDPVTSNDHILGNPNAPVVIVEYSDFECPFCKQFHATMNRVMDEFAADGNVAWVYRHLPLDQLHPKNARRAAVASECVAELAGEEAFWTFTNRYYDLSSSNDRTDYDPTISQILGEIGVDATAFEQCVDSGRYDSMVQDSVDSGFKAGARGTPYSVVIAPDGTLTPIAGALDYNQLDQFIRTLLADQGVE